jgi:CRISPR-associated protein Csx17
MTEVHLAGCTPEPLMSYLKALGVFRLVAEQADPAAKLSWHAGHAVLHSQLDRTALTAFFREQYAPTPILAPWGARSGFYAGTSEKAAREALDRILAADSLPRLEAMRAGIMAIRQMLKARGFDDKVKDEDKLDANLPERTPG